MTRPRILVVEDEDAVRRFIVRWLGASYDVREAATREQALRSLAEEPPDVLLTDVGLPDGSGTDLVAAVAERGLDVACIVASGTATIEDFRRVVRLGALDYLAKPVSEAAVLRAVARALEMRRLRKDNARLRDELSAERPMGRILGTGPAMRALREDISRVASSSTTVLVTGESGAGKELVARTIHEAGPRRLAPFVPVACGAMVETLLEGELFGHVRGAFTGADSDRTGCFEAADGGTLFLDEISAMSPALQVALLRALQQKEITRVGDSRVRPVDVRVIAATSKALEPLIETGRFRADLFYRLNVVNIRIPPLRERGAEDVAELARHLCALACERIGRAPKTLTPAAVARLAAHAWPGNVRELENAIARAVILTGASPAIDAKDLILRSGAAEAARRLPEQGIDLPALVEAAEWELIRQALDRSGDNKQQAARLLGIGRTALVQKLARRKAKEAGTAEEGAAE